MVPSPAWVDPFGQLFVGTHDIRPFEKVVTNSIFSFLPNMFESLITFKELSQISCDPTGLAWSNDNTTLFLADGHTKNISRCNYDGLRGDATNCTTVIHHQNLPMTSGLKFQFLLMQQFRFLKTSRVWKNFLIL